MTLARTSQDYPDEVNEIPEIVQRVRDTTKALDDSTAAIHRWFWKGLLAFNLILWSVALCVIALSRLV